MFNVKKIIVTGSSSGIGNSITKALIKNKIEVIGISRNNNKSSIKSKYFQSEEMDLSELKYIPVKIEKILGENEDIDGLISCAGAGYFGSLENFSVDKILSSMNTNLLSHVILTKYLVPFLKKKNKGKLVYIGSESALDGGKKGSLYSAAKFGLRGFTQSIRAEVASRNITVTLINPGMVKTNFFNNLDFQPGLSKKNSIIVYDIAKIVISILQMDTNTSVDEVVMNPIIKSVIKK